MVRKHFVQEMDVNSLIADLEEANSVQRAIGLLHILGDLSVGRGSWGGYTDFEAKIVRRIHTVMKYADSHEPFYHQENKDVRVTPPVIARTDETVRQKALQVLACLLEGADNRDSTNNRKYGVPRELPAGLLYDLVQFFSHEANVPVRDPARKEVAAFLRTIYKITFPVHYELRVPELAGLMSPVTEEREERHRKFHDAVITPIMLIHESNIFVEHNDFRAIPRLESFVQDAEGTWLSNLEEALVYWYEKKDIIKYHAAQACLLLKIRRIKAELKEHSKALLK